LKVFIFSLSFAGKNSGMMPQLRQKGFIETFCSSLLSANPPFNATQTISLRTPLKSKE